MRSKEGSGRAALRAMVRALRICPTCGLEIPADAPQGACPGCLLESGLGAHVNEDQECSAGAETQQGGRTERVAALAGEFGDYELLHEIGRGGQGIVYLARQKSLNRTVALKILRLGQWASRADLKRFRREAAAAASLDHLRIVPIYEVGERDGSCYFSMKFVEGGQLDEVISRAPISMRQAAEVIAKVARTVHYAHQHGILHRDIKPGNILLDTSGEPHLTDFGLARLVEVDSTVTETEQIMGTPSYMAPEQATDAKSADHRSDIFSMGRILYELYSGDTSAAVQDLKRLPIHVAMIVDTCTKSNPDERFQSVEELHQAFMSIVVARGKQSDNERILELMEEATDSGTLTDHETAELADLVAKVHDDPDLLHDLCMKLPAEVIGSLWEVSPVATKLMIKVFTDKLTVGGWDFGYTDEIGQVCIRLHNVIPDYEVRGMLIAAIVEVGVSHNRWNVMDLAAKLLSGRKEPGEGLAIAHALSDFSHRVRALEDRVVLSKVDPAIRVLFRDER